MRVLDSGAADLFAASPFPGDAATGQSVDAYVDESVAALRRLRTGADELQRALAIRARRRGGGACSGTSAAPQIPAGTVDDTPGRRH